MFYEERPKAVDQPSPSEEASEKDLCASRSSGDLPGGWARSSLSSCGRTGTGLSSFPKGGSVQGLTERWLLGDAPLSGEAHSVAPARAPAAVQLPPVAASAPPYQKEREASQEDEGRACNHVRRFERRARPLVRIPNWQHLGARVGVPIESHVAQGQHGMFHRELTHHPRAESLP